MNKKLFLILLMLPLICGCYIRIGDRFEVGSLFDKKERVKVRWEEEKSITVFPWTRLRAKTAHGKITVTGADVNECYVHAHITVEAPNDEKAQEIANQVSLSLQPEDAGKTLVVSMNKPKLPRSCSVFATYDITLPRQAHLDLETSFGTVAFKHIQGTIRARTSHGEVRGEALTGPSLDLKTSFGKIRLKQLTTEKLLARTSHGPILADFTSDSSPALQTRLETSFGEIKCTVAPSFSGEVQASTSFGDIHCGLPVTVQGAMGKSKIRGRIGDGQGQLRLHTSFGDIHIIKGND